MAWTNLTFSFGSVLTSAKQTQLYDDVVVVAQGVASTRTSANSWTIMPNGWHYLDGKVGSQDSAISLPFMSVINSYSDMGYTQFRLIANMQVSTNSAQPYLRLSTDNTSGDTSNVYFIAAVGGGGNENSLKTFFPLAGSTNYLSVDSIYIQNFDVMIINSVNSTATHMISTFGIFPAGATYMTADIFHGNYNSRNIPTGLDLQLSTGSFYSYNVAIYGAKGVF